MLALYQTTGIRNGLPSAVELWGEIREVARVSRREIIPEPDHPAADDLYHVIRVGPVERLERPIVSRRPRRVTFIRTTSERLFRAVDINDLVIGSSVEEKLWGELRELDVERKYLMQADGLVMEVDFAIFYGETTLGIVLEPGGEEGVLRQGSGSSERKVWSILRFSPSRLDADLAACVQEIMTLVHGDGQVP